MPAGALTHGEPRLWIALKPFAHLNRFTRARWSERHADSCHSCACGACRCWRRGGVSRRRQHERQASAHAPDVRPILRAERANFTPHNVNQLIRVPKRVPNC